MKCSYLTFKTLGNKGVAMEKLQLSYPSCSVNIGDRLRVLVTYRIGILHCGAERILSVAVHCTSD